MKKKLLIITLTIFCIPAFAQNFQWAQRIGGLNYDYGYSIALDTAGNIYTAGVFDNTVDFDPGAGIFNMESVGQHDIFITKTDAQGNFVWAKQMGGAGDEMIKSITIDVSGNIYTTGSFSDTADFDPGAGVFNLNGGLRDIFISKLDASGNFVWAKCMGNVLDDYGQSIIVDQSGNVYVTGYFHLTVDFDPGPATFNLTSSGYSDIFILKLNASGNFVWAKSIGGVDLDIANSIALDSTGNFYVTGWFHGTVDFDPGAGTFNMTSIGGTSDVDIFILKCDSSGSFIWAKLLEGAGLHSSGLGQSITLDAVGNVYLTGDFNGTVDFDPGSSIFNLNSGNGNSNVFILKLDASGNFIWAISIEGGLDAHSLAIKIGPSGGVYITGGFQGTADFDPDKGISYLMTSLGVTDIFVLKLDTSGNFVWAKSMGGANADKGYALAVDASGNVYTTGSFQSTADFDPGPGTYNLTSEGNSDAFILKLATCLPPAGSINGLTIACAESTTNYSTSSIPGAITYYWTTPTGSRINSGQNTSSINLTFGLDSGTITVTPRNSCGTGLPKSLPVKIILIPTVGFTAFPSATVCAGSPVTLNGTGADIYTWSGGIINGIPFVPDSTTTYTLIGSNSIGCANTITAKVIVNPLPKIIRQPTNQYVTENSNTTFITNSTTPAAAYQWQQNSGNTYLDLYNIGPFSGVNTNTLVISPVSLVQNNYTYRCVITDGVCSDTSNAALLTVFATGINDFIHENIFTIFPNPANNFITIKANITPIAINYFIKEATGRQVLNGTLNNKSTTVDISNLAPGFYFIRIDDRNKGIYKLVKQ
jgi:hypothetical protein